MASSNEASKKPVCFIFIGLVVLTLLTPFWVFKDLLFPFVTSKAFYLRILVELTLPFYLYLLLRYPQYRPSLKNPVTISVLAFFLFNLLAGLFGVNVLRSIWGNFERMGGVFYLAHLTLLYFYVLMAGQISTRYLRLVLQFLVAIGAVLALDAIIVELTHNHFLLNDPSYPRVSGTFGNPIFIASFLVVPLFLAAFFAVSEQVLWKRIYYWATVLMAIWVIFLSETRGAVVGLGVGVFVSAVLYVILNPIRKLRVWGSSLVLGFGIIVVLLFSLHNHLPQGGLLHRVFNLKDADTQARLIQWGVALKGYKDHPILGVGPENYYVISNKYYNPEIFQYDPSWFDKPHNYLIEVLVTSGIFGFAAYLGMLAFSFWAMWAAFRKGVLILSEFCLLVAGLIVYQVQNLFVFDTVGASMAFFMYIGFMAYLWHECYAASAKDKKVKSGLGAAFCAVVFWLAAVLAVYLVYVGNVTGIEVGRDINYGYAYSAVDPQTAKNYFEQAQNSPFDFDPIQFASKYADFANNLALDPQKETTAFVTQNLNDAIAAEKDALVRVPTDPTGWQELANLYLSLAVFTKTPLDPAAVAAVQQSMVLAPVRPEGPLLMARLDIFQNNISGAENLIQGVVNTVPKEYEAQLQLGLLYAYNNQVDKGLSIAQAALDDGYVPQQTTQIDWMADDYQKENNFAGAAKIYALMFQLDPTNLEDLWLEAQMDAQSGDKTDAIQIAQSLIQSDPNDASHFQAFINTLK